MSVTIRTLSASVNVPNPTASSTFDNELESYLSKAVATGETSGIHGIIQGFKLYPNPNLNNSWVLTPTPTSVAVFRNSSGGNFLYLETPKSFGFTLDSGVFVQNDVAIACLVPDFVAKRISLVLYTIGEQTNGAIPESSVLLGLLISDPNNVASGDRVVYSGMLPLGVQVVSFHRTQYDPGKKLTAVYTENFVGVSPSSWVTTSGSYSTINDSDLGGAGKALQLILGAGDYATITFPHVMTPYYDNYGGNLVNANNKVRAKVTYFTDGGFVDSSFAAVFLNQSGSVITPIAGAYWVPTDISSPRSFYVELSPDPGDQQSDGNYRLRLTGDFTGELYITSVEFETDLDNSGTYLTNVIYVPSAGGGGGGGGGVTIIPDGGTISGVYQGDVLCEGGVIFANNVTIYGSLNTKQGFCVNNEGYGLIVGGTWISDEVDFNVGNGGVQNPIEIQGDWIFRNVDIEYTNASGGIGYYGVIISGDLIGTDYENNSTHFRINGLPGNRGGYVYVYGNVNLYNYSARGGEATNTLAGEQGGYLTVEGNLKCRDLFFEGGDSNFAGMNAGSGGEIDVEGDLLADDIRLQGGDSDLGGNAGNGGDLNVRGVIYAEEVDIFGGYCNSDDSSYRAGSGGNMSIRGEINIDECNLNGGERSGTLSSGNSVGDANGGNVSCRSNAYFDELYTNGGNVYTSNHAPHAGGSGGSVDVTGNLFVEYFEGNGGQSNLTSYTGNGSYVNVGSSLQVNTFYFQGGAANTGVCGNGGQLYVSGELKIMNILSGLGGTGDGPFCTQGGNGGVVNATGDISAESIVLSGGDCYNSYLANSPRGGIGGNLIGNNITCRSSIQISGGTLGNSEVASLNAPGESPNAGQINSYGNLIASSIIGNGGSSFTGGPSSQGGNGAGISVKGNLILYSAISINGGTSSEREGGNGGSLDVDGSVSIVSLQSIGGDSIGGIPLIAGSGGNTVFKGGGKCSVINMSDGIGGSVPAGASWLVVGGTLTVGTVSIPNRSNGQIKPYSDYTAILKLVSMPEKTSLTSDSGVDTDSISSLISDSIFLSTAIGDWFVLQGIPISTNQ